MPLLHTAVQPWYSEHRYQKSISVLDETLYNYVPTAVALYASARAVRENTFMCSSITTLNCAFKDCPKPLHKSVTCHHQSTAFWKSHNPSHLSILKTFTTLHSPDHHKQHELKKFIHAKDIKCWLTKPRHAVYMSRQYYCVFGISAWGVL